MVDRAELFPARSGPFQMGQALFPCSVIFLVISLRTITQMLV